MASIHFIEVKLFDCVRGMYIFMLFWIVRDKNLDFCYKPLLSAAT